MDAEMLWRLNALFIEMHRLYLVFTFDYFN
jgi:hypothetical protein